MQAWEGDLNPTQYAVLDYLSRANRFSRSPSQVADYLGTTRGTISQSLKSLGQKSYVTERRSLSDKRTISFDLTDKGSEAVLTPSVMTDALSKMNESSGPELLHSLDALLGRLLKQNGGRSFGICKDCKHFNSRRNGGHCSLLSERLSRQDSTLICHEQEPA